MRIHHVQIGVPPEAEATVVSAFYEGVLGLAAIPKPPESKRPGWWFRAGEVELHIGIEAQDTPPRRAHTALQVQDWDALKGRAEAAGAPVDAASPLEGCRRFHTRDPYGNRLEILEGAPTAS